jgi:protein-tyrosine kinase
MSKNFELMQHAEMTRDIPATEVTARHPVTNGQKNGIHLNWKDKVGREESFKLVQNVFLLHGKESPRVVSFAGIDSGNGCSWICARVAEILASQRLGSVCLVDANLHSPSLPEMFGVSNHYGLSDALCKNGSIQEFTKVVRSDNLSLLSCGSQAAASLSLLNSEKMKARVAELRKQFDYILIDSPPLNAYSDGVAVGQLSDGLVLVLEANSTRREAAAKVVEDLRAAQIKILGAVFNKRTFPIPEALYNLL